jgi:hypothetical protein
VRLIFEHQGERCFVRKRAGHLAGVLDGRLNLEPAQERRELAGLLKRKLGAGRQNALDHVPRQARPVACGSSGATSRDARSAVTKASYKLSGSPARLYKAAKPALLASCISLAMRRIGNPVNSARAAPAKVRLHDRMARNMSAGVNCALRRR